MIAYIYLSLIKHQASHFDFTDLCQTMSDYVRLCQCTLERKEWNKYCSTEL